MLTVSESGNPELKTYSVESGKLDHTVKLSVHVLRQENWWVYTFVINTCNMNCTIYLVFYIIHVLGKYNQLNSMLIKMSFATISK